MAYNLQSLIHILEPLLLPQNDQSWILEDNKPLIESLLEKALYLRDVLETSQPSRSNKGQLEALESKISDAAHKAEDLIESRTAAVASTISSQELQRVIDEFDTAKEVMAEMVDEKDQIREEETYVASPGNASRPNPSTKKLVVGLDADLLQLKHRLTGHEARLEIIPIVGMGGLGKTTLAQMLYDDALVVSHFDTRAWVTISQVYDLRGVLLRLLGCLIGKISEEILQMRNDRLADMLYKSLYGRRYLIIFDDMWSIQALADIKRFLPDVSNNSRIMLTTRDLDVANSADPNGDHHKLHLLNPAQSWQLLREKVFAQEPCPEMLQKVGEKILANCRGLPLAISVIGGLLSTAKHNQEFWKEIADNTRSIVSDREQFSNIFSLSYDHLPSHLRPCFLYFGAFPEDYEIRSSKLIRLWVAEGFLKPIRDKSLEEAAEVYLKSLVHRNLISVRREEVSGKVETYGIHDLLRDLCLKKAIREKFCHVINKKLAQEISGDTLSLRRVSVHPSSYRIRDIYALAEQMSDARSFLCTGLAAHEILSPIFLGLRLLRVLDVLEIVFGKFPEEMMQLINLRYLAYACNAEIPSYIERLINLHTLIVLRRSSPELYYPWAPSELWKMQQLRHVKFKGKSVMCSREDGDGLNQNMQTLSNVQGGEIFVKSFPNLTKLGLRLLLYMDDQAHIDLGQQEKLEALKCAAPLQLITKAAFLPKFTFPPSLRKLTLLNLTMTLGQLLGIGSLRNLQVLKLKECRFQGEPTECEWEVGEGEFNQLQLLVLEKLNLVHWKAEESPFPKLQRLVIRECTALTGIPGDMGHIPTLQMIELHNPSPGAAASAGFILEEQHDYGNDILQVRVYNN